MLKEFFGKDHVGVPVVLCFRYVIIMASGFSAPTFIFLTDLSCVAARKVSSNLSPCTADKFIKHTRFEMRLYY